MHRNTDYRDAAFDTNVHTYLYEFSSQTDIGSIKNMKFNNYRLILIFCGKYITRKIYLIEQFSGSIVKNSDLHIILYV